ncbi:MAG: hypothetical protein MUF72_05275 [Elainella sp. Prado103]|nr:hypothetical protein [Elainella sp. Prado103]
MNVDFVDFADLEQLASLPIELDPQRLLQDTRMDLSHAPLHELFDLLETAVESYTLVRDHLATALRETAEQEIEFYLSLLQDRLNRLLEQSRAADRLLQLI